MNVHNIAYLVLPEERGAVDVWAQNYDPLGNIWLSSLVAAVPIIFFFLALTIFRLKGYVAGTITVALTLAVAIALYGMPVHLSLIHI